MSLQTSFVVANVFFLKRIKNVDKKNKCLRASFRRDLKKLTKSEGTETASNDIYGPSLWLPLIYIIMYIILEEHTVKTRKLSIKRSSYLKRGISIS